MRIPRIDRADLAIVAAPVFYIALHAISRDWHVIASACSAPVLVLLLYGAWQLEIDRRLNTVLACVLLGVPIALSAGPPRHILLAWAAAVLCYLMWPHRVQSNDTMEGETLAMVLAVELGSFVRFTQALAWLASTTAGR